MKREMNFEQMVNISKKALATLIKDDSLTQSKIMRDIMRMYNRDSSPFESVGIKYVSNGAFRVAFIFEGFVLKTEYEEEGKGQCDIETAIYKKAKERGVEKYLATAYGSFLFLGIRFYLYEKINKVGDFHGSRFDEKIRSAEMRKFLADMNITDLHAGNFGQKNGKYVLTDYTVNYWDSSFAETTAPWNK